MLKHGVETVGVIIGWTGEKTLFSSLFFFLRPRPLPLFYPGFFFFLFSMSCTPPPFTPRQASLHDLLRDFLSPESINSNGGPRRAGIFEAVKAFTDKEGRPRNEDLDRLLSKLVDGKYSSPGDLKSRELEVRQVLILTSALLNVQDHSPPASNKPRTHRPASPVSSSAPVVPAGSRPTQTPSRSLSSTSRQKL
jgi:hypothetical protein